MDHNHENFAELVTQYLAAARSSAQATTMSQSVSYPQYDPRDQRSYYEAQCQMYDNANGTSLTQEYAGYTQFGQPFNVHHHQQVTQHLTSVHENPERLPFDRKRERSMGYYRDRHTHHDTPDNKKSKTSHANTAKTTKPKLQDYNIIVCDICKVSCAGELPYKEHLNGKQHKKKESAKQRVQSTQSQSNNPSETKDSDNNKEAPDIDNSLFIRCTVCNVTCCGKESYESHLRGAKHKKVVGLSQRLGSAPTSSSQGNGNSSSSDQKSDQFPLKVLGAPVINFVKGGRLHTIENTVVEIIDDEEDSDEKNPNLPNNDLNNEQKEEPEGKSIENQGEVIPSASQPDIVNENIVDREKPVIVAADVESESPKDASVTEPPSKSSPSETIGEEYVKEIVADGIIIGYNCTLCSCQFFNNASKLDHLRGRRHKFNYNQANPSVKAGSTKRKSKKKRDQIKKQKATEPSTDTQSEDIVPVPELNETTDLVIAELNSSLDICQNDTESGLQVATPFDYFLSKVLDKSKPKEDVLEDLDHMMTTVQRALDLIANEKFKK